MWHMVAKCSKVMIMRHHMMWWICSITVWCKTGAYESSLTLVRRIPSPSLPSVHLLPSRPFPSVVIFPRSPLHQLTTVDEFFLIVLVHRLPIKLRYGKSPSPHSGSAESEISRKIQKRTMANVWECTFVFIPISVDKSDARFIQWYGHKPGLRASATAAAGTGAATLAASAALQSSSAASADTTETLTSPPRKTTPRKTAKIYICYFC